MFYKKPLLVKKVSDYKITFSSFASGMNSEVDEGILPYKYAKSCYNFTIKNGALKNGIGFSKLKLPKTRDDLSSQREIVFDTDDDIKAIWLYKYFDQDSNTQKNKILYYTTGGKIMRFDVFFNYPYTYQIASVIYPQSIPNAINYRLDGKDYMIFSSKTDGMWKYNATENAIKIENAPSLVSMCLHYERLFAIIENGEHNRLAFSATLDPTNFNESLSEGGFIDMQDERGALNKVVSFNDYVYVFRDFGVSRVSAYGDQTSFSVSQLFVSSAKIYGNSVCVCGDKIMLLTRDGIMSFDGYNTTKLSLGIEKLLDGVTNENCSALYFNNKYYLACKLNFNDGESIGCESYSGGYVNNAIIEVDLKTGDVNISRGMDIRSMIVVDDANLCKVIACFNGEHKNKIGEMNFDGEMFSIPLKKCWTSPKSNLGYPTKVKRVKEVLIKSKNQCKIVVKTEDKTKTFIVYGSEKSQRKKINVFGEQVELSFVCDSAGETEISCPQITIGVTN